MAIKPFFQTDNLTTENSGVSASNILLVKPKSLIDITMSDDVHFGFSPLNPSPLGDDQYQDPERLAHIIRILCHFTFISNL